jgi:type IX secretion system PorP/SprF family membrane protein
MIKYYIKIVLFLLISILFSIEKNLFAQEFISYFSMQDDKIMVSPSFAGYRESPELYASFYRQWTGIEGSPTAASLSFNTPLSKKMGFGLAISNFRSGNFRQFQAQAMYAYKIKLKKNLLLIFGFDAAILKTQMDLSHIISQGNDPILQNSSGLGALFFNAGGSILLQHKTALFGISVPSTLATEAKISGTPYSYSQNREFIIHGSYNYKITGNYSLEPALIYTFKNKLLSDNSMIQISLDLNYMKKFDLGFGYKINNGYSLFTGIDLRNNINLQYVYEFGGNALNSSSLGTHRIIFCFKLIKKKTQNEPYIIPKIEENTNFTTNPIDNSEIEILHAENERIRKESNRILSQHERRIEELEKKLADLQKNQSQTIHEKWEAPFDLQNIKFGPNSDKLYSSSFPELNKIVNLMVKDPTAEVQFSAYNNEEFSAGYNLYLSEKRAKALSSYLINRGISPNRIKTEGKGCENIGMSANAPNRIEIRIKKK